MGKNTKSKKNTSSSKKSTSGSTRTKEKQTVLASKPSSVKTLKKVKEASKSSQGSRKSVRLAAIPGSAGNGKDVKASSERAKAYRRNPADIDTSEDDEHDARGPATFSKHHADSQLEEMSEDNDYKGEDDETKAESGQEEDLAGLSAPKAKEALRLEQPQWSAKRDKAPSQKDTKSEDKSHKKHTLKRKRGNGTDSDSLSDSSSDSERESESNSELRSGSSDSERSDRSESSDLEESDDNSELDNDRKGTILPKMSKRAQDRRSEGAKWKSYDRKASASTKRKKVGAVDINNGWSRKAHYAAPSSRSITLKDQPKHLQRVLKKAMEEAEGDILFLNAFPSGASQDHYICQLLKHHAKEHKNPELVRRIKQDDSFSSTLAPLITSRMSRIRGGIKKHLGSSVIENAYSLPKSDQIRCQARVAELQSSMDYIYPIGSNGIVDRTKPYRNDLVIRILRDYIFTGRPSLASKFSDRFESSVKTDQDNVEIPIAMLALVGTAISAGLEDWSAGKYDKKDWNTENHSGAYANHVEFITSAIFKANKKKFHSLMSKLYQLASDTPVHASGSTTISNAQLNFNIDDMKDDD